MRFFLFFGFLLLCQLNIAQTFPIDFESSIVTADFIDFDGGTATVISNPQSSGINTSASVAQIVRNGGQIWAGSKLSLAEALDFTSFNAITMKVFTTAPAGTTVKFKLESSNESTERDVQTTVSNEWETLTWDFTGTPPIFNELVFMFDFGNVGDGSINSTFLFDDIDRLFGGTQIDLPVDFEDPTDNYTMSDFGGNSSSLVTDPTDPNNTVIEVIKTDEAATWAGTTIGTPAGFATDIPLTLTDSEMIVRVWSPEAGTPIRLKVEDSDDPTHTCETETNTTVSGEWETLVFDFTNQAPGTESLSVGLSMGWTYNMASIFFNFGTEGASVGAKTYYFDGVRFGDLSLNTNAQNLYSDVTAFPNPANEHWTVTSKQSNIKAIDVFDNRGNLVHRQQLDAKLIDLPVSHLSVGVYCVMVTMKEGVERLRLIKH